MKLRFQANC